MASLSPTKFQNITEILFLSTWILFLFLDLVHAQASTKNSDGTTTRYYLVIVPGGAFAGFVLRKCCCRGKSKEIETSNPTNQTPVRSTIVAPTRYETNTPVNFTSVTPIRPSAPSAQTNISAGKPINK